MMFRPCAYIEYLENKGLQDTPESRDDYGRYCMKLNNLETSYYSLLEALGMEQPEVQ